MDRKRRTTTVINKMAWTLKHCIFILLLFKESQGMRDMDSTARSAMGALQRDMKMLGDITICTGLKRYIACIEGSNLAITKAFWGRISDKVCPSDDGDPVTDCDGSEDTLPLVKGYCEGKRECKLEARHTLLQKNGTHHCPGVNKYLIVNYTCIPESKSATLCDSAETTLMCEAGWVIDVADIFWGRRSHAKYCGAEEGMECDSSDSAAKYIRAQCDGKRRCPVKADQTVLDNTHSPCSGILKYLMINYVCKPPEKDPLAKEMIGLLENRFASDGKAVQNLQNTDSAEQKDAKVNQREMSDDRRYPAVQQPSTAINYATRKPGKKSYFLAPLNTEEKDELSDALLGGIGVETDGELGSEHSIKKQEVPDYDKDGEKVKDKFHKNHQQKKDETSKKGKDDTVKKEREDPFLLSDKDDVVAVKKSKDETEKKEKEDPFFLSDKDDVVAVKKDKEEIPKVDKDEISVGSKTEKNGQVTGSKRERHDSKKNKDGNTPLKDDDTLVDQEFSNISGKNKDDVTSKVSEPATVRSILARAKEVLQTLDTDSNKYQPVEKRENIAANKNATEDVYDNIDSQIATFATNLTTNPELGEVFPTEKASNPIAKNIIQQTAAAFAATKPKPSVKKTALPQRVPGFGNTP